MNRPHESLLHPILHPQTLARFYGKHHEAMATADAREALDLATRFCREAQVFGLDTRADAGFDWVLTPSRFSNRISLELGQGGHAALLQVDPELSPHQLDAAIHAGVLGHKTLASTYALLPTGQRDGLLTEIKVSIDQVELNRSAAKQLQALRVLPELPVPSQPLLDIAQLLRRFEVPDAHARLAADHVTATYGAGLATMHGSQVLAAAHAHAPHLGLYGAPWQANKATRKHKDEPTYTELVEHWQEALKGFDLTPETLKAAQGNLDAVEHKSDAELLELLHENEAVFNDIDLVRVLGMEYAGKLDAAGLDTRIEQFKADNGLVLVNAERLAEEDRGLTLARKHTEDRFCAPWMLEAEQAVVDIANRRANETQHHASQTTVDRVIEDYQQAKGFQLSQEQLVAVNHICRGSGGVANLSGLAGTGKTTISELYKEALESEGMVLLGVCVSNKAAQKLEVESGMPSTSMAQMLHDLAEGKRELQPNDVLVIDEAGMVDTRDTRALLSHAEKAKSKVILQGDAEQLQPIGAGSGFQLTKQAVGDVKLTEIRRQARQEDRETAMGFYAKNENGEVVDLKKGTRSRRETLELGDEQKERLMDSIVEAHSQEKCIERLVNDYFKNPAALDDKLVLAHSRAEVSAVNARLRQGLKERGEIGTAEVVVEGRVNGRKFDLALVEGDRVMFTAKSKDLGVVNGTQATIQSFKPSRSGGYDIVGTLRSENPKEHGRKVVWNTHEHKAVVHDYAVTVHKSQGQGKREVFHLMNLGMMDNASSLVAFTRLTKGHYRLYGTYDDVEQLNTRLGLERLKATVLDAGLKSDPQRPVVQLPEAVARPTTQRPAAQRTGIQGKLDALLKGHKERLQHQMSESERKARWLLEVLEPLRRARQASPKLPAQSPKHTQGFSL